jgi:hypothetical protein
VADWIAFAGVIVRIDAPADTPEGEIADRGRQQLLEMLGEGSMIDPRDIGVGEIQILERRSGE